MSGRFGSLLRLQVWTKEIRRAFVRLIASSQEQTSTGVITAFGQKTHLTALSCGLLMIITQEPAQSLAALETPLTIEVPVPRK
jgi:hypothetical protein